MDEAKEGDGMKLKPDHVRYLGALRPAHWRQLMYYIWDAQKSGIYWGNRKQYQARLTTLEGVFSIIERHQRGRVSKGEAA